MKLMCTIFGHKSAEITWQFTYFGKVHPAKTHRCARCDVEYWQVGNSYQIDDKNLEKKR